MASLALGVGINTAATAANRNATNVDYIQGVLDPLGIVSGVQALASLINPDYDPYRRKEYTISPELQARLDAASAKAEEVRQRDLYSSYLRRQKEEENRAKAQQSLKNVRDAATRPIISVITPEQRAAQQRLESETAQRKAQLAAVQKQTEIMTKNRDILLKQLAAQQQQIMTPTRALPRVVQQRRR